ncbi:MAG: hypothetical protein LC637_08025 [Xanthomonadaceae bacterium]|nr:hypothetical protein [Xanthomonadaceae bacterium]
MSLWHRSGAWPLVALLLLLGLAAALLPELAVAQDKEAAVAELDERAEPVEFLSLAAVLIGDGNYQRARNILARVDTDDEELDLVRYYTLSGLVALNLEELALAAAEFERAIEAGQQEPVVWLYLAQSYFGQQQYEQTLTALDQAGEQATRLPSVFLMRAQAHWELKNYEQAWQVMSRGRVLFPDRVGDFARRQVFLLVDQGLYQEAAEQGMRFLASGAGSTDDAIAIGNALRETGQYDQAAALLEKARLGAPDSVMLGKVLSRAYLDKGQTLAAADVMRTTAVYDAELVADAAELYRRAGWLIQALMLNGQVIDQARKLKQRLAIFIELARYDQAAGMESDLTRVGLLDGPAGDEDIRYALAYAMFKTGEFERAEYHLARLTRADLFRRAVELRRAMEQCAEAPWLCG